METSCHSLTPETVSIQPEPQDFETIDREFGPLPWMPVQRKEFIGIG